MKEKYFPITEEEISYLCKRDPFFGAVITKMEKPKRELLSDFFSSLIFYIISHQISAKAAKTEWSRFQESFSPVTSDHIVSLSPEEIQKCGTTLKRSVYIKKIAEQFVSGALNEEERIKKDDDEFCKELVKLPGIGFWTAQMILIHVLKRKDVISYQDIAIHRGMCKVYKGKEITKELFEVLKQRYSPYGTIASIYFWTISTKNTLD